MIICLNQQTDAGCGHENPNDATHCQQCGMPLKRALEFHDPGTVIGSYRIVKIIGYGGFGAVYEAENTQTGESVALKQTFNPENIRAFRSEFNILRHLSHDHLPHYHEMFEEQGNGYLVMELIPGQSLSNILQRRQERPLAIAQVIGYAIQLCELLAYLHTQDPPLIHRDIKPDNIRITPDGLIKLVDFGLFKRGLDTTRRSRIGGTTHYAPLEQLEESNAHTCPKSDIYSLGVTLYQLLTGRLPPSAIARVSENQDPLVPPHQINPQISETVSQALVKALAIHKEYRFADAIAFKLALFVPSNGDPAGEKAPISLSHTIEGHAKWVTSVAWSPDGTTLASGSNDDTIKIWDVKAGTLLHTLEGHTDHVLGVAWSPDGTILASGSSDNTVKLWDPATGTLIHTLESHGGWVNSIAWSPDGMILLSASSDTTVKMWDPTTGTLMHTLEDHDHWLVSLAWSPDGETFACGSRDKTILLWNLGTGTLSHTIEGHISFVLSVAWSPDGTILASGSGDNTVKLWNPTDGTLLRTLEGHMGDVNSIAWSPDGTTLASGALDETIKLWDTATGGLLHTLEDHFLPVHSVAWSPDGTTLASGARDGTIRLWK